MSSISHPHFIYTIHASPNNLTYTSTTPHQHFTNTSTTPHQHFSYTSPTLQKHLDHTSPTLHQHFSYTSSTPNHQIIAHLSFSSSELSRSSSQGSRLTTLSLWVCQTKKFKTWSTDTFNLSGICVFIQETDLQMLKFWVREVFYTLLTWTRFIPPRLPPPPLKWLVIRVA